MASLITRCRNFILLVFLLFFRLSYTLASLIAIRIMSTLIRRISRRIDPSSETRPPLNTDGARPNTSTLGKHLKDLYELAVKAPVTLSDLVL